MLEREKWRSFLSGKITGGLAVINVLDLGKERKIEILADALRLSRATATDYINDLYEGRFSIDLDIYISGIGKDGYLRRSDRNIF